MKRGFLTTARAKKAINDAYAAPPPESSDRCAQEGGGGTGGKKRQLNEGGEIAADPLSQGTKDKGKGKERVVDEDAGIGARNLPPDPFMVALPPRPVPRNTGWGRSPEEAFFHTIPALHGGKGKKRAIFSRWPRDPNGQVIKSSKNPRGTLSPDGYPWGETLYDFCAVDRIPEKTLGEPCMMMTYMTGSALLQAMTEIGELDTAVDQIEWAKSEGKPQLVPVTSTAELVDTMETRVLHFPLLPVNNEEGVDEDKEGVDEREEASVCGDEQEEANENEIDCNRPEVDPASLPHSPEIPITSPFHPSHYPAPWPLVPFEYEPSILLQERIPFYLLPHIMYVHDPFRLLSMKSRRFSDVSWTSRPDVVRTYQLYVSESACKQIEEERHKAEEVEEFKSRTLVIMRYRQTKEQIKNHEPTIEVPLPPYPRRMTEVKESHLYMSPVAVVGQGNHSVIYKCEWELPRDLFVRPKICPRCFEESAAKELQRLKDTGRYEKMMRAIGLGPDGYTGRRPTREELAAVNDPPNCERNGEIIEREITCVVPAHMPPSQVLDILDQKDIWGAMMKRGGVNAAQLNFVGRDEDGEKSTDNWIIRLDPPFSYESQKGCTHGLSCSKIPRTAKFTVIAKLSIEHDDHLANEATNYQKFPEHFFHHYNGYTINAQLHSVVPVNAIVPQFYGYYRPVTTKQACEPYVSPILLLEHCGEPVNPTEISEEDQEECASLLLRFQRAGWIHESVAPRNFLVQKGRPADFPLHRMAHPELSFRLIDFGRSRKYKNVEEKRGEEFNVARMFEKIRDKMNVTFSPLMG